MQYLVGEPYCVSPDVVYRMTINQIKDWYFCERDKNGLPLWVEENQPSEVDRSLKDLMDRGASEDQAKKILVASLDFKGSREEWIQIVDRIMANG